MTATPIRYRLAQPVADLRVPTLDDHQQQVVDHAGGPLLVLAGPGTGKTTTMVEAIVDRIEGRGARPDQVLALTFSRKAAEQLRDRVTARLGRTMATGLSSTFHSFAYGLIRQYAPAELYTAPLRILSAPEQDVILRELLSGAPESVTWPESLGHALGTRGFAHEVQSVLSRAREKGLEPEELAALGREHDLPEYVAAGLFLDQYLTNLDHQGATDYADLIRRATIEAQAHRAELRERFRHVFVDEYQDTDPGQVELLRALAGDGRNLTVVGDPHQSIYAFRGAEIRGILEFPTQFPQTDGSPADVVALSTVRRFGPRLLAASRRITSRLSLPGTIDPAAREAFLAPSADNGGGPDGRIQVLTYDTERAEAEHLADLLRRAHIEDGVAWHDMAVLVRSGRSSIPALRRSLGAAGVPVEVAADEVPLVRDPAVAPLLEALRAVVHHHVDDPEAPGFVDPGRAESLLLSPLGGLDAGDLRRLARVLRVREKAQAPVAGRSIRGSRELVRAALFDPTFLDGLDAPEARRARSLAVLLAEARALLDSAATAEEVLWQLWSGTRWPARLRRAVETPGAAARRAHRDLDSVCALFETAARAEEQRDHAGVRTFLDTLVAQQIPADSLADRGAAGSAVRLLTAHRAKGLEWRLVVVAHVQAEQWPDLRHRATLLRADRIGRGELLPAVSAREQLLEERRLFYVAVTRATERLVVTAVASTQDDGEQPSRFLDELVPRPEAIEHVVGRPVRPLSMDGLVSALRRTLADPASPPPLADAAARRLARLARETDGARPLVPQADPATWWGTRAATRSETPVRDPERPIPMSASVLESLQTCPTQWYLDREAGGAVASHQSANIGLLLHALAEKVAKGEVEAGPDDADLLMEHVDRVWDRFSFRTPWSKAREHDRVRAALGRFLRWHHANPRTLLATEASFQTVITLDDSTQVKLSGYADRLEVDADGNTVVVDLKTGRAAPTGPAVAKHLQLALYQYAVDAGAVASDSTTGGAELVQLGLLDPGPAAVVQRQAPQEEGSAARDEFVRALGDSVEMLRAEHFPAVEGAHCRYCAFTSICPIKGAGAVISQ